MARLGRGQPVRAAIVRVAAAAIAGTFAGNVAAASADGLVGTFTGATPSVHSAFPDSASSGLVASGDTSAVTVATAVYLIGRSDISAAGVRVYIPAASGAGGSGFIGYLMDSSTGGNVPNRILASQAFGTVTTNAWNSVTFSSSVALSSGPNYWFAVYMPPGRYGAQADAFGSFVPFQDLTGSYVAAKLDLTGSGGSGNGSFAYGSAGTFPVNTSGGNGAWYGVDPLVYGPSADPNGSTTGQVAAASGAGIVGSFTGSSAGVFPGNVGTATASGVVGTFGLPPITSHGYSDALSSLLTTTSDFNPVTLATCFYALGRDDATAAGVRVYVPAASGAGGTGFIGYLLDSSTGSTTPDRILQTKSFGSVPTDAWTEVLFNGPTLMTAGKFYWVAVFFPNGRYGAVADQFTEFRTFDELSGVYYASKFEATSGNGSYSYGPAGSLPTSSGVGTWYGVDAAVTTPSPLVNAFPGSVGASTGTGVVGSFSGGSAATFAGQVARSSGIGVGGTFESWTSVGAAAAAATATGVVGTFKGVVPSTFPTSVARASAAGILGTFPVTVLVGQVAPATATGIVGQFITYFTGRLSGEVYLIQWDADPV